MRLCNFRQSMPDLHAVHNSYAMITDTTNPNWMDPVKNEQLIADL